MNEEFELQKRIASADPGRDAPELDHTVVTGASLGKPRRQFGFRGLRLGVGVGSVSLAVTAVALAVTLGWQVSLWDSRPANARREYFLAATNILREPIESLHDSPTLATCDAAIVMSHNLQMDAAAINLLQKSNVKYLALLGPTTRKQQVLQLAQLTEQTLAIPIAGPAGLDLGGELPEAIALSILAECHARLQRASGQSLSGILNTDLP